jgi:hypothetical protein
MEEYQNFRPVERETERSERKKRERDKDLRKQ